MLIKRTSKDVTLNSALLKWTCFSSRVTFGLVGAVAHAGNHDVTVAKTVRRVRRVQLHSVHGFRLHNLRRSTNVQRTQPFHSRPILTLYQVLLKVRCLCTLHLGLQCI